MEKMFGYRVGEEEKTEGKEKEKEGNVVILLNFSERGWACHLSRKWHHYKNNSSLQIQGVNAALLQVWSLLPQ